MTNYKKLLLLVLSVTICCSSGAVFSAEKMRVVYHVSEANKVAFVLGNMRNHIKGVGGADKLNMVLVVHGPAGKEFHKNKAKEKVKQRVEMLEMEGIQFNMCGNTMNAQKVKIGDLLPGFSRRDEGGVVRIAELQSKGYIYIRP